MEEIEELGEFWLPEDAENTRSGILTFGHRSAKFDLTLFNPFEDPVALMASVETHQGYPVIFGVLASGQPVTLTNAQIFSSTFHFGGIASAKLELHPDYIFLGAHLGSGLSSSFSGFRMEFEHFNEWAFSGVPATRSVDEGSIVLTETSIEDVECDAFGGHLKVRFATSTASGLFESSLGRSAYVEFDLDESTDLRSLTSNVSAPLQYFLTFACGVPVHPVSLGVSVDGLGQTVGTVQVPVLVEVGYRGWHGASNEKPPTMMRLPLATIRGRFGEVVTAWEVLYGEQERAMLLLFSISLGLDLYLDTRFLFAVQAVELYHRKKWPDGVMPKMEHKQRVKDVVDGIEDRKTRTWLKEKLAYSNEPTLRQRLEVMLQYSEIGDAPVFRDDLPRIAADTRNYLTHFNPRLKAKAAADEDLFILGREVMALLELCLLRDLGFDGPTSLVLSSNTPLFQYLLKVPYSN